MCSRPAFVRHRLVGFAPINQVHCKVWYWSSLQGQISRIMRRWNSRGGSGDASTSSTQEMKTQWMANGITLDTQELLSKAQAQNYAGFIFLLHPDHQFGPQIHLHYLCCWRCTFRWGIRYALSTHLPTSDNKQTRKFSHCCSLSSLNPNSVLRNVIHNYEKWRPALIDRGRDANERRDAEIKVDSGSTSTGESK